MQTNFRGRDLIGDLDFTKEEVETVLDVAWDLKRKRASANHMPICATKCWQCCSSSPPPAPAARSKLALLSLADMARSSTRTPPRSHMAIRRLRSARSLVAILTALPFGIVISVMGTNI